MTYFTTRFSTLFLFLTALTVIRATPIANPFPQEGIDVACSEKYCTAYEKASEKCIDSFGAGELSTGQYTDCICTGDVNAAYKQCLGCYSDEEFQKSFSEAYDLQCSVSTGSPDTSGKKDDSDPNNNKEDTSTSGEKKNDAQAMHLNKAMVGAMVVAGGFIAAM